MTTVKCVTIEPNNEINALLYKYFTNSLRYGYVEVGEEKICMPEYYREIADEIEDFQVRGEDVFVCSHPKTGTTWTQEMVWMILHDLNKEKEEPFILERSPFIEFTSIFDYRKFDAKLIETVPEHLRNSVKFTENHPGKPRIIKTHLPWSLLPKQIRNGTKKPKIIYVVRNPKDTCVSYYHHGRLLENFKGDLEIFAKLFLAGRLNYGPFWTNVFGYWNHRNDANILIIRYEEMKQDLATVVKRVADFLGKKLSHEQILELVQHLSFDSMKANKSCNYDLAQNFNQAFFGREKIDGTFMRSGTVGSYKAEMSENMIQAFDQWTEKHLEGTDFPFYK